MHNNDTIYRTAAHVTTRKRIETCEFFLFLFIFLLTNVYRSNKLLKYSQCTNLHKRK